jgi:hypothetical protein
MSLKAEAQMKRFVNSVKKRLSLSINAKQMGVIARYVVELIKERSRRGYGVASLGGQESRFPKLTKEYIKQRKRSRLSPFTSPGKSNITRTGKLLASIRYTTKTGSAIIEPVGSRNDSNWTNRQLADHLQTKMNRPFMTLSAKQLRDLTKFIETNIIELK